MRVGTNPEKNKYSKILYKKHRIIIPVFIPESNDEYYTNLFNVLKLSLNSLFNTVDKSETVITIINNNSKTEITQYLDELLENEIIDKHVKYANNKGKVFTIMSEAKASYEDFITIADCDVFYFSHWEKNVFNVFEDFTDVGVVSPFPAPQLAFYNNVSLFYKLGHKIKQGSVVSNESFIMFEKSINNNQIFLGKRNWKKSQYYIQSSKNKACIVGAGHFVATYRGDVLRNIPFKKPNYLFKDGDEIFFIDQPIDKMGYYRLSLCDTYVYHLGNKIPDWIEQKKGGADKVDYPILKKMNISRTPFYIRKIIYKLYRKRFK